ncbi:hypothetical protein EPI10_031289 [Gossypium australe]|uniref:Retrotransposon gag protein n=1 Tax=Gossypium australe TaxID=47621 RepID=A0A5B6X1B1_9ROSI|nr:hypothetical protein EPI10_031289 [Gossypium australe]
MGQLATELRNRPQETLPNDMKNPRNSGKKHCKEITLQSGIITLRFLTQVKNPSPPHPQRLQKRKQEAHFKKFLDVIKQLHINPLVEALEQMPNYVKCIKDIPSKKRSLGEFEIVALKKDCSAFLQNKLSSKFELGDDRDVSQVKCSEERNYPTKRLVENQSRHRDHSKTSQISVIPRTR